MKQQLRSISIAFQTDKPLAAYGPLASTAEEAGFDGITVYNDMLYQPAWLPLLEIARATHHVQIGPAAVNPFTCHPINIAANIALIDEVSNGRTYLGLARGGWLDFVGLYPKRAIQALDEAFGCVRHLLSRSTEPLAGAIFPLAGGDALRWAIDRPEIPFLLGTWGSQTIRACINHINEIKIGGTANPDVVPLFRQTIARAAGEGGQTADEIGIAVGAVTVVDEDGNAARALARREVALYLPVVADLDKSVVIEPELLGRIRTAAEQYDFEAAGALISDELLARFAFAGTPDQVAEQAENLFNAGATRVEFGTPHGLTTESGLRLLGKKVLPGLR